MRHHERRLTNLLVFTWFLCLVLLATFRCGGSPSKPSPNPAQATPGLPNVSATSPAPETDPLSDCDIVGLKRSGIRHEIEGKVLRLFVPMEPTLGEPYVNVWTPEVNTRLLRRCPANAWCDVRLPSYGEWTIRLAAETRTDAGRVYQCDRHAFTVVAKRPPPPTPPPPVCPIQTECSFEIATNGWGWGHAIFDVCRFTGTLEFKGTHHKRQHRFRVTTAEVDVGCECITKTLELDTYWRANFSASCQH